MSRRLAKGSLIILSLIGKSVMNHNSKGEPPDLIAIACLSLGSSLPGLQ